LVDRNKGIKPLRPLLNDKIFDNILKMENVCWKLKDIPKIENIGWKTAGDVSGEMFVTF
jgi:hypothetical protein